MITDPYLALYTDLSKHDGSSFMSDDAYGHTCTVTGSLWRLYGRYFDGTDDKIALGTPTALQPSSDMTIDIWMKAGETTGTAHRAALSWYKDANNRIYLQYPTNSLTTFKLFTKINGTEKTPTLEAAINANWNHFVIVFTGTTWTYYKNGVYLGSNTAQNDLGDFVGTATVEIGAYTTSFFKGRIGEVRIYNRNLSATEASGNYEATKWRYI